MTPFEHLENISAAQSFYDMRDQLKRHVYDRSRRAFDAGDAARDKIRTRPALAARRQQIRKAFLDSIGGLPPSDTPLNSRVTGRIQAKGFHIENILFDSRPGVTVTANLYVPDGLDRPTGAILFLSGHHETAKLNPEYQTVCQILCQAGLIVLAQDPIGQGERLSYFEKDLGAATVRWGTTEHQFTGNQCLLTGEPLGRYFVHDAMRGVDYLLTRKEVDGEHIGVTGNSGGGTQTSMMMMADPRIAAAAPATFIMNRRTYQLAGGAQDSEQIWPGMSAAGFDHEDILLAMCPKPVCVLAVKYDFFPIEGTRETVRRCRRLWRLHGRESDLKLVEDASTHKYTPMMAAAAATFFARHLNGVRSPVRIIPAAPLDPVRLQCTRTGQIRGDDPDATGVFDENCAQLKHIQRERRKTAGAKRRAEDTIWLRAQILAHRQACDLNPRFYSTDRIGELDVEMAFWRSQEDLYNHGVLFRPRHAGRRAVPAIIAVWDDGVRALSRHQDWITETCLRHQKAVLVLETSGVGTLEPFPWNRSPPCEFYGIFQKLNDDLIWLGDSLTALRSYDVLRALDMLSVWPGIRPSRFEAYAHGRQGLYARLAARVDPRISKVTTVEPGENFAEVCTRRHYNPYDIATVLLPGALQHMDVRNLP